MSEVLVGRRQDNMLIREGDEWVRKVFNTARLNLCTSTLGPGMSSSLDTGHEHAEEVCYVLRGTLVIHFPDQERYLELNAGDAVLIPTQMPHQVFNPGSDPAESVWCGAPGSDFRPVKQWKD